MYQKILVPLDGSNLAECVLPHVEALARGCQVKEVVFTRVVEPIYMPAGDYMLDL
jgi:nucleotide-binding universal stress UspA family protein